jgi:diphosphomevalonate decarboxylase
MMDETFTAVGTPNIAIVKYWGRRDNALNLPHNPSLSITLDERLNTRTSVLFSDRLREDGLYINGKLQNLNDKSNEKVAFSKAALDRMRHVAKVKTHALIVSENSFPSSAGLASSASGAATLVFALAGSLELNSDRKELSIMARQISGSACRSLFGGIVLWKKGTRSDGSDSHAQQFVDERYWPEVIDLIAIISDNAKKVSSSTGHAQTVATSSLYKSRPAVAEQNVRAALDAIKKKDFDTLAKITMQDSNSLHAVCLDTFPPIFYMNDTSREIAYAIHEINDENGSNIAAYTFDAGPNAHIITTRKNKTAIRKVLGGIDGISEILEVGQGSGPRRLGDSQSLIDEGMLKPV